MKVFGTVVRLLSRGLSLVLLGLLTFYKGAISPWLPAACRFSPSCSVYAMGAIRTHGPFKGSWLAARRLGRCHPFHPGGYDPVPGLVTAEASSGSAEPTAPNAS